MNIRNRYQSLIVITFYQLILIIGLSIDYAWLLSFGKKPRIAQVELFSIIMNKFHELFPLYQNDIFC